MGMTVTVMVMLINRKIRDSVFGCDCGNGNSGSDDSRSFSGEHCEQIIETIVIA